MSAGPPHNAAPVPARGKTILMIVHHERGDAGRVTAILKDRGYALDFRNPLEDEPLPETVADYAGVAIFGGTMSARDDHLPGIRRELDWIAHVVQSGCPLFGCCLGGQLIARALGARVWKQPESLWQVGYHPVHATAAGETVLGRSMQHFFTWHEDGFDVPAGAELLATGDEVFPNQAFRYGTAAYALQFHPEASPGLFGAWMDKSPHFESRPGAHSRERIMQDAAAHEADAERWLRDFLALWCDCGEARAEAGAG